MFSLIERYIKNLDVETVNNFALSKNIIFSNDELNFTYLFIKKNWQTILSSQGNFNIERYKNKYSEENYVKIVNIYKEYKQKYSAYL